MDNLDTGSRGVREEREKKKHEFARQVKSHDTTHNHITCPNRNIPSWLCLFSVVSSGIKRWFLSLFVVLISNTNPLLPTAHTDTQHVRARSLSA